MKKIFASSIAIFICAIALYSCTKQTRIPKANWLFVQSSTKGSFEAVLGDSNRYTLSLKGVTPCMISFTDRPIRMASTISTKNFVDNWNAGKGANNFKSDPPNAALVLSVNNIDDIYIFSLQNPSYDANTQTLTYTATPITITTSPSMDQIPCTLNATMPASFGPATLFIDDSWGGLGG